MLKFVGKILPWPSLNRLIDLAEILNANARGIYETKKRLLELGDDATVKQIGDGKDIVSVLSACNTDDDRIFRTKGHF
jgi:hypothetical protein